MELFRDLLDWLLGRGPRVKFVIKAAPGRVLLSFPSYPDEEQKTEGGIYIPQTSVQIPEIAEVLDVGEPVSEEERKYAAYFLERKERGEPVLADFGAGVTYWRVNLDANKYGWLKPIRSYRLSSPSAHLERSE